MNALIVGNTSVIGQAIAARLKQICSVSTAGRQLADIPFDLSHWQTAQVTHAKFDCVIHVAADFGGDSDTDFIRAELVNSVGTLSVCSLAHQVGAKHLILISSVSATYEKDNDLFGIYALSKRHSEELAEFYCTQRQIKLTILRPTQVYDAAGECRKHQALFYLIADCAQAGRDINFFGNYDARRNYIYLEDIAEICCRVVEQGHSGIFSCGFPESPKLSEIAQTAFSVFDTKGNIHFLADKPNLKDLPYRQDNSLYQLINYYPKINIRQGFMLIKNHRENNP